jgi:hypothetical protein
MRHVSYRTAWSLLTAAPPHAASPIASKHPPLPPSHPPPTPQSDYMDPNIPTKGFLTNVRFMFDLRDVVIDVQVGGGGGGGLACGPGGGGIKCGWVGGHVDSKRVWSEDVQRSRWISRRGAGHELCGGAGGGDTRHHSCVC